MAINPVLYNIANLQSGKSTGAFRGVRAAPALRNTELPTFDSAKADSLLESLNSMKSKYAETRNAQDARYAALPGLWAADYAEADNYKPGTKYRSFLYDRAGGYQYEWKQLPAQINAGFSAYQTSLAPLQSERTSMIDSYKDAAGKVDHLAFASPSASDSPASPTQGASLAATDLYSDDLETAITGRKQEQLQLPEPEDDVVTGAMQSSIYSRGK